jgi:hypothetical protein
MRFSKWMSVPVVLAATFGLVYCGKPVLQASHTSLDENQAQGELDLRLAKTEEVKSQVKEIRKALRPVQSLLHDLGKLIDLKVHSQDKPGEHLAGVLKQLEELLQLATHDLVTKQADGSWMMWTSTRFNGVEGGIGLLGKKIENGEEMTLLYTPTTNSEAVRLAVIRVAANGSRELSLSASLFDDKLRKPVRSGSPGDPCHLSMEPNGAAQLDCEPMNLHSGSTYVGLDRLEFRNDPSRGASASALAYVYHLDHGMLASARLHLEPGKKAQIDVCGRDETCAR